MLEEHRVQRKAIWVGVPILFQEDGDRVRKGPSVRAEVDSYDMTHSDKPSKIRIHSRKVLLVSLLARNLYRYSPRLLTRL